MLVLAAIPVVSSTEARATSLDLSLEKKVWWSNETITANATVHSAPYGVDLYAYWTLMDSGTNQLISQNITFRASSSSTEISSTFSQFYSGTQYLTLYLEIRDGSNYLLSHEHVDLAVIQQVALAQWSDLIAFGDSLSDMGNAKDSILNVPDVPPYWNGRFSNGPVWIEYVSDAAGLNTTHGSGISAGDNRAFGGSQTGQGYSYLVLPNVGSQINSYLNNVRASIPSTDMVTLWAGGNDFLYGLGNPDTISANMESHIRALNTAGAQQIIVANLPPLEGTPEVAGRSQSEQNKIASDVVEYNNKLSSIVNNLRSELGMTIHFVDAWSIYNEIVNNKEHLGLVDTSNPACSSSGTLLPLPICNSGDTVSENVDEFVYFDKAHPTARMHRLISMYLLQEVGSPDTDGDGIIDSLDDCDWTEDVSTVDENGCSWAQQDSDEDGVVNRDDLCPGTNAGEEVDSDGCADYQKDTDGDGLSDDVDPCPADYYPADHDSDGCSDQVDSDDDNDGIIDDDDNCPRGMIGNHSQDLDNDGCNDDEDLDTDGDGLSDITEDEIGSDPRNRDTDNDSFIDGLDAFPLDPNEWYDSDSDGYGDNGDAFPNDPNEWSDRDFDEVGDNADAFPDDPLEWQDSDSDGVGDNSDACVFTYGLSQFPPGCPDKDGDGYSDDVDEFPSDANESQDTDQDGHGDNSDLFPEDSGDWQDSDLDGYGDNRDAFPSDESEWNDSDEDGVGDNADVFPENPLEWIDSDLDGCGDNGDAFPNDASECLDSDGDGYGDNEDAFPMDPREFIDTDGDGLGDNADQFPNDSKSKYDSDGDGVSDALDPFPNTAAWDSWMDMIGNLGFGLLIVGLLVAIVVRNRPSQDKEFSEEMWTQPVIAPSFSDFEMAGAAPMVASDEIIAENPSSAEDVPPNLLE